MNLTQFISIIIPFYNESDNLEKLYSELKYNISKNSLNCEIIFVDDGSIDESGKIVTNMCRNDSNVTLITLRTNCGKSVALNEGVKISGGDIIVTMDADNQDNPACIIDLIKKLNEGYDVVSGWKEIRKDSIMKTLPSKLFNRMVRIVTGLKVKDINSGFKAYKRWVWENIILQGDHHRFLLVIAREKGAKVIEIPVVHRKRIHGVSKYGFERFLIGMMDLLFYFFFARFRKRPSHFFIKIGLLLFIPGGLIVLWFLVNHLIYLITGDVSYGMQLRPILFFSIMLILAALQLSCIGIIAEYMLLLIKPVENVAKRIDSFTNEKNDKQ